jgi:LruC domain-containing protein
MKNFKRSLILPMAISFLMLAGTNIKAQVTLDCESGNRAIEQGNCWGFGATGYASIASYPSLVITGSYSTRSNSLTNLSLSACWIKTPWLLVGNGNITFQTRLDGNGNGVTAKGIVLSYIPYDAGASYGEGTEVQFYTYNFPEFNVTTIRDISAPIPVEIQNSTTPYKIWVSYIGTGGNERAYSDNFIFPGTYWASPPACTPLAFFQDADNDGVADNEDNYPNDPYRAYNNYYPGVSQYGTLAFEDNWPNKADYDFNDIVVNYRLNTITNAQNNVVEILGKFVLRASGASFRNAFAFQIDDITPDKIISTSGNSIEVPSIFGFESNGLESNQQFANCIVFDNFFNVMPHPGSGTGINTDKSAPTVPYDTLDVNLVFISNGNPSPGGTVTINQLPSSSFNFYIISNQERGREIHLADKAPTSLVSNAFFGTGSDDSNPGTGRYYKTSNNLPWGINILQGFDYPIEKALVNEAYLHFIEWAESSGISYPNWYSNESGFRDDSKIY